MEDNKDLDLEALSEEVEKELEEERQEEEPEEEELDSESEEEPEEDPEEEPEPEDEEEDPEEEEPEEEEDPKPDDDDVHKRNEAFKKLREERDSLAESDKFLKQLAETYGMSKEELVKRYQEDINKKKAKEQGMEPEQYKRMQELEERVQEVEKEKQRELFNIKANQIADKYNLKENDMMNLFSESSKLGLDVVSNPDLLEFAYKAVNYEKALEEGKQKQLETSKKRRSTSTGKTGTSGKQVETTIADYDKEIDALLDEIGLTKN